VSDYEQQVRDYLAYCRGAWKQLRGNLNPKYHPTGDGAVKMIAHRGDAGEAKKIREAFRALTEEREAAA
jgi:hypothetical protein